MKVLKWLCTIFLVLGLGMMFTGFALGGFRHFVYVDNTHNLASFNYCTNEEEINYLTNQVVNNSLVFVAEDDFNDVSVVSVLNGLIKVVETDYYDYVKVLNFESLDIQYKMGHGNGMHGGMHGIKESKNNFTSLSRPVDKVEFLGYNKEDHCDNTCRNENHLHYNEEHFDNYRYKRHNRNCKRLA